MEALLREKLGIPDLRLLLRFVEARLFDNSGSYRLEFSGLSTISKKQQALIDETLEYVEKELTSRGDIFIAGITYNVFDEKLHILVEASSLRNIEQNEIAMIEEKADGLNDLPVTLFVYLKNEAVLSTQGPQSYSSFPEPIS